jgi:hypothetical protein
MSSAVKVIDKLWVNGALVEAREARFEFDRTTRRWWVRAALPLHHPYEQRFGLSMRFEDGSTAHGRARMADLDEGQIVVFEGEELEEVSRWL